MWILIAHEALAGGGGIESYLAAVIPALVARGHQLAFLHLSPAAESGPLRLDHPAVPSWGVDDIGLDASMDRARAFAPDVCFSHNIRQLAVDAALAAAWPTVKMMHGYFGTCISSQKTHAFPSAAPCARRFGAACLALYVPRYCGQLRPGKLARHFRWASTQHALLTRYAAVLVASRHMADEFARHGVDRSRLVTAPLFPTIDAPAAAPHAAGEVPTVLFAGRLTPLKGPDVLVRAAAVARSRGCAFRLVVAGNGPEAPRLEALAASLGVDAHFPGWVAADARRELFRSATLLAFPRVWPEPFGLAGLEAAAHGVPAVGFDVGGIREWLRDGISGRIVTPHGSAEALGAAIAALLADPAELSRLGRGAAAVAAELTLDAHLDTVEQALTSVQRPSARRFMDSSINRPMERCR